MGTALANGAPIHCTRWVSCGCRLTTMGLRGTISRWIATWRVCCGSGATHRCLLQVAATTATAGLRQCAAAPHLLQATWPPPARGWTQISVLFARGCHVMVASRGTTLRQMHTFTLPLTAAAYWLWCCIQTRHQRQSFGSPRMWASAGSSYRWLRPLMWSSCCKWGFLRGVYSSERWV